MRKHQLALTNVARLALGIVTLVLVLAAPVAAVQTIEDQQPSFIGQDLQRSSGAGLVLLVSLQRG